jgi:hypothetical protein
MTVEIYHGSPITPADVWPDLFGRDFCVSFFRPDDIRKAAALAGKLMLDNGAFSFWRAARKRGQEADESERDWSGYYDWAFEWLFAHPDCWAVVPDAIAMPSQINDGLLNDCPLPRCMSAPVYHMDEPVRRLGRLLEMGYNRVCIGWVGEYDLATNDIRKDEKRVGCQAFLRRMDEIDREIPGLPWGDVHMLRGIAVSGLRPFQKRGQHQFSTERTFV